MAEEKKVVEDAAAALKLANEKRRAEFIEAQKQAWLLQNPGLELTPGQEYHIEQIVDAEMAKEAQTNAAPVEPLSKSQEALKEQISKFSSVFKGGRFEFVGIALEAAADFLIKLMPAFQSLLPMLKNIAPMLNRAAGGAEESFDETPVERVQGLADAGKLNDANELLQKEDLKLIKDMKKAFESDKEAQEFKNLKEDLTNYRRELKALEHDLEELTPLKQDGAKKVKLGQHLEKIEQGLKTIKEHYDTLEPLVAAAGDSLKSVSLVFDRMKPILEAHQKLFEREEAALPKAAAPPPP